MSQPQLGGNVPGRNARSLWKTAWVLPKVMDALEFLIWFLAQGCFALYFLEFAHSPTIINFWLLALLVFGLMGLGSLLGLTRFGPRSLLGKRPSPMNALFAPLMRIGGATVLTVILSSFYERTDLPNFFSNELAVGLRVTYLIYFMTEAVSLYFRLKQRDSEGGI